MKQICMALDLKDDDVLIERYVNKHHHSAFPRQVAAGLEAVGVQDMEIYVVENRLFMIMKVDDDFSFERKRQYDNDNIQIREWDALMWSFQNPLPNSLPGEKWRIMKKIFSLSDHLKSDDICVMSQ